MNNAIQSMGGGTHPVARPDVRSVERATQPAREEPARADRSRDVGREQALRDLPDRIQVGNRSAEFSYDKELDRVVVRIYSSASEPREIVREIPPEEYRAFATKFREMIGLIFDETI